MKFLSSRNLTLATCGARVRQPWSFSRQGISIWRVAVPGALTMKFLSSRNLTLALPPWNNGVPCFCKITTVYYTYSPATWLNRMHVHRFLLLFTNHPMVSASVRSKIRECMLLHPDQTGIYSNLLDLQLLQLGVGAVKLQTLQKLQISYPQNASFCPFWSPNVFLV